MCGYFNDSMHAPVSDNDLRAQVEKALQSYRDEPIVKIFTSGSFLDNHELSTEMQHEILKMLSNRAQKISVESRPDYVTEKTLSHIQQMVQPALFEVGIGLETSNDLIRELAINKGFTFNEYKKAASLLKKHQMNLKTYVLMKPPFLTEKETLQDCLRTAQDIASFTDMISLNPCTVQRHTIVEYLWKRNQYRPPWLWTVVEFLKQSKTLLDAPVKCDVTGGGSRRGAHNCEKCDLTILHQISEFSLSQKTSDLKNINCDCKEQWKDQLDLESLSFGALTDFARWNP
jgi:radical SAM enzyme (TIGR01210 family)